MGGRILGMRGFDISAKRLVVVICILALLLLPADYCICGDVSKSSIVATVLLHGAPVAKARIAVYSRLHWSTAEDELFGDRVPISTASTEGDGTAAVIVPSGVSLVVVATLPNGNASTKNIGTLEDGKRIDIRFTDYPKHEVSVRVESRALIARVRLVEIAEDDDVRYVSEWSSVGPDGLATFVAVPAGLYSAQAYLGGSRLDGNTMLFVPEDVGVIPIVRFDLAPRMTVRVEDKRGFGAPFARLLVGPDEVVTNRYGFCLLGENIDLRSQPWTVFAQSSGIRMRIRRIQCIDNEHVRIELSDRLFPTYLELLRTVPPRLVVQCDRGGVEWQESPLWLPDGLRFVGQSNKIAKFALMGSDDRVLVNCIRMEPGFADDEFTKRLWVSVVDRAGDGVSGALVDCQGVRARTNDEGIAEVDVDSRFCGRVYAWKCGVGGMSEELDEGVDSGVTIVVYPAGTLDYRDGTKGSIEIDSIFVQSSDGVLDGGDDLLIPPQEWVQGGDRVLLPGEREVLLWRYGLMLHGATVELVRRDSTGYTTAREFVKPGVGGISRRRVDWMIDTQTVRLRFTSVAADVCAFRVVSKSDDGREHRTSWRALREGRIYTVKVLRDSEMRVIISDGKSVWSCFGGRASGGQLLDLVSEKRN